MATPILFLALAHALVISASALATCANNPGPNFITTSCRATRYPALCVRSLAPYTSTIGKSPRRIATIALTVSVERAKIERTFIAKLAKFHGLRPGESAALSDCLEELSEGVDRLSKSISEMKKLGRAGSPEFKRHLGNMQTWVSGALTDEGSCADGFSGRALNGRIKSSVRARMANVAQVTSNALALCNKLAGN